MKTIIIAMIMLAAGFGLAAVIFSPAKTEHGHESSVPDQQYTCGMHPEIVSDEPGYCPLCGMKLTPKKNGSSSAGAIKIDPTTSQNMGIVMTAAMYQPISKEIKAFGKVDYNESKLYNVNLKVEGWVEKLYVDQTGTEVIKSQPLLELYSPKLITAQKEYLVAYRHARDDLSGGLNVLLQNAKERLANWDISDDQIENLIVNNEIKRTMTIRSPADGIVITKGIIEGEQLKPGMRLYQIADLSSVWVKAYIYEQDIPFVSTGQIADINFPNVPNLEYSAKIIYVSPFLDTKRQAEIRLNLDNPDRLLRPDMYAEVSIGSRLDGDRLTIPRSAVINSGVKQIVYVAEGNDSYNPRIITTGVIGNNDMIEILAGLKEGESVVTSGQFMLDSESRLNEALSEGRQIGHDHSTVSAKLELPEQDEHADHGIPDDADSDEPVAVGGHDIYTCPMPSHYHVLQYGAGTCSECGMTLVSLAETDNEKVYVCPMSECGTVQDHGGVCPVCGMNLVRYQPGDEND